MFCRFCAYDRVCEKAEKIGLNGVVMANNDTNTARIDGDFCRKIVKMREMYKIVHVLCKRVYSFFRSKIGKIQTVKEQPARRKRLSKEAH